MATIKPHSILENGAVSLLKDSTLSIANMDSFKGLTTAITSFNTLDSLRTDAATCLAFDLKDPVSEISYKVGDRIARP